MANTQQLGAKLGPRLAQLTSKATADTFRHTLDMRVRAGALSASMFFRTISAEISSTVAPFIRELAEDPDTPQWARNTLRFMADGRGEWQVLLNLASSGAGMAGGIGGLIGNEIAPLVQKRLGAQPNAVLPPATLAAMTARRLIDRSLGRQEAGKSAIGRTRFDQLVDAAGLDPEPAMLFDLEDRGLIGAGRLKEGLRRLGFRDEWISPMAGLARALLSPELVAGMVVRGVVSEAQGVRIAAHSGLEADDFRRLVLATGNPPGTMDLLAAFRRGIIGRDRLHKGIRQGDLRNEWIDVIERLRFAGMTAEQAIAATVQGHLAESSARRIAQQDGLLPEHFKPLLETAGNPPGVETMLEMWNRGDMTRAQVVQGIRESRYKTKYVPQFLALRHRVLPQDTVRLLLRRGLLTRPKAISRLLDAGYSAEDAGLLAASAAAEKTERHRDLTAAQIETGYEEGALDRDRAKGQLVALGFDAAEAEFVLSLSDMQRARRRRDQILARIRSKFVGHRLADAEAQTAMDRAGVPAAMRDGLLASWDIERDANVAVLSAAQLTRALSKGLLTEPEVMGELRALGYDERDAGILIALAAPAPKAPRA